MTHGDRCLEKLLCLAHHKSWPEPRWCYPSGPMPNGGLRISILFAIVDGQWRRASYLEKGAATMNFWPRNGILVVHWSEAGGKKLRRISLSTQLHYGRKPASEEKRDAQAQYRQSDAGRTPLLCRLSAPRALKAWPRYLLAPTQVVDESETKPQDLPEVCPRQKTHMFLKSTLLFW